MHLLPTGVHVLLKATPRVILRMRSFISEQQQCVAPDDDTYLQWEECLNMAVSVQLSSLQESSRDTMTRQIAYAFCVLAMVPWDRLSCPVL